jgi:hypothetical protein
MDTRAPYEHVIDSSVATAGINSEKMPMVATLRSAPIMHDKNHKGRCGHKGGTRRMHAFNRGKGTAQRC